MKKNKGYSLVELIIVIAIMAILIGILAPQLIKYIEKSKISSDTRSLEAIYDAVIYSANDPNVVQDPDSAALIDSMMDPVKLEDLDGETKFAAEIKDVLGWDTLDRSEYEKVFRSTHDPDNLEIVMQFKGGVMNPIAMWVTTTDITGKKDITQNPDSWENLGTVICIK